MNPSEVLELSLFRGEEFGDLIKMPDVYNKNKALANRASSLIAIKKLEELKASSPEELNSYEQSLQEVAGKLKDAIELMKKRRMPHTGYLNRVIKSFTSLEGEVDNILNDVRNAWRDTAAEKKNRERKQEEERQRIIDEENRKIEEANRLRTEAIKAKDEQFLKKSTAIRNLFYSDIDKFEAMVKANIMQFDFGYDDLNDAYYAELTELKNDLVDKIPGRREELKQIAAGNKKAEEEARKRKEEEELREKERLQKEFQEKEEQERIQAEANKLKASFSAHSAVPMDDLEMSKGTKVKLKYVAENHAGIKAIMQWWAAKIMPALTIEELENKFSFMFTAANQALNKSDDRIVSTGLKVEEEIKTRITKK